MTRDCLNARAKRENWLPRVVLSSNGQGIALAAQDPAFAELMEQADIIHADGMPVVFASRMTAHPLPERIATTDFFHDAAKAAEANKLSFFLLGATEVQNAAAAEAVLRTYPGVRIAGRHHGYFSDAESDDLCAQIRQAGTDVLWVALGKPRQERWAIENKHQLVGVGWIKTCGGLYEFLAGEVNRAPRMMQRLGLEWLFRAKSDPRRLLMRYLTTNPVAAFHLLTKTQIRRPRE